MSETDPSCPLPADLPPAVDRSAPDERRQYRRYTLLYREYPSGIEAELVIAGEALPCRIVDLSLGGTCLVPAGAWPATFPEWRGGTAAVRCPEIGDGQALAAVVCQIAAERAHLAFALDAEAEHALAMFLVASEATLA